DEAVDLGVAILVDFGPTFFLFVQALAEQTRGVAVVKNVPACFELHLKLRNAERPPAEGLHQAALEIKEAQQTPRIFFDGKFSAELAAVARETVRIRASALVCSGAFF